MWVSSAAGAVRGFISLVLAAVESPVAAALACPGAPLLAACPLQGEVSSWPWSVFSLGSLCCVFELSCGNLF